VDRIKSATASSMPASLAATADDSSDICLVEFNHGPEMLQKSSWLFATPTGLE
jgi:hypothetical protein